MHCGFGSLSRLFLTVLFSWPLPSSHINPATTRYPVYQDADGYRILSILLTREGNGKNGTALQINAITVPVGCDAHISDEFRSAYKDFVDVNHTIFELARELSIETPYEFKEKPEQTELPPPAPGEKGLSVESRRPFYSVSAVGFGKARTRAMVYLNSSRGNYFGGGLHMFKKSEQGWTEVKGSPICQVIGE
jgi:hypothetical protein